ncbi:MAG TPA: integrase domain-containing protein [Roseovarius sp.]|nr:integrase domain-containing protein [Roseovarius sp.]
MSLYREMMRDSDRAAGSTQTRDAREGTVRDYVAWAKENNIQTRHSDQIKPKHVRAYGQHLAQRVERGEITVGTGQNRMSHMRGILRAQGRDKTAAREDLTNAALGLSGRSRDGTNQAISDQQLREIQERVPSHVAAGLEVARAMGLRSKETVAGCVREQLKDWERELTKGNQANVVRGTKGGRMRTTHFMSKPMQERALTAVRGALSELDRMGRDNLIEGRGGDLKSGVRSFRYELEKAGLTKAQSQATMHSIRYAWTQEATAHLRSEGYGDKQARTMVSTWMGHGDGRGRYVAQVYLR